jgi:hypothetical protein
MQTLLVGVSTYVVVLSGELDGDAGARLAGELERLQGTRVVIDMIDVTFADARSLEVVTRATLRSSLTVVAERGRFRTLELAAADGALDLQRSLHDAVADAVTLM